MSYLVGGCKPIRWIKDSIKTPPFSKAARIKAGILLRMLQAGVRLSLPESRPLPVIGPRCHELRIRDGPLSWRIIYSLNADAIVILAVVKKKSRVLPSSTISTCKNRLEAYTRWEQEKD
ncbi:MAG: type II toxin-antitoxin system RelE/ParE family toxin [Bacteroidetes bacterium]|nr:type II toxin-antitoxin system RelE/ParE family toxin [Bacteroidota bacterium]